MAGTEPAWTCGTQATVTGARAVPASTATVEERLFPERAAGGFGHLDHRMAFLTRVHAVLEPTMTVLDFGAGRGKWQYDPAPFRRALGDLRGKCRKVIGADVDEAILQNDSVDERVRLQPGQPLPFADASFDMILSFSVFEHIEDAAACASELGRVLKPGGWIIGWTPNRHGYVGVCARLVPTRLHRAVLKIVEPRRAEGDSFPPVYRLNDRRALARHFPPDRFEHYSHTYGGQPFYHGERLWLARCWQALFRILPATLQGHFIVILRKRDDGEGGRAP